jgi:hypothetical protein
MLLHCEASGSEICKQQAYMGWNESRAESKTASTAADHKDAAHSVAVPNDKLIAVAAVSTGS